jgi:hypothetical protein
MGDSVSGAFASLDAPCPALIRTQPLILRRPSGSCSSVQPIPWHAVGIDNVNLLGDFAVGGAGLAELETLVAIDRGVAVLDHAGE